MSREAESEAAERAADPEGYRPDPHTQQIYALVKQVEALSQRLTAKEQEIARLQAQLDGWHYTDNAKLRREIDALQAQLTTCQQAQDVLLTLAAEATNGWACYARREKEHSEIARLHQKREELAALIRRQETRGAE